jgi:hypothetical protein
MLNYARKNGALYSSAIVSIKNEASKGLMEKLGFKVISRWSYLSIKPIVVPALNNFIINKSAIKVANFNEYKSILDFLNQSETFKASGKKFVSSWRWHDLTEDRLRMMINNKQVIILANNDDDEDSNNQEKENKIRGIAIIDEEGYWNNENILQFIYIEADSDELFVSLIIKSLEWITSKANKNYRKKYHENKYKRVQIFSPSLIKENSLIFQKFNVNFSEQFLLYHKRI